MIWAAPEIKEILMILDAKAELCPLQEKALFKYLKRWEEKSSNNLTCMVVFK